MTIFAKIRALALLPVCVLLVACDGADGSGSAAKVPASHSAGALHDPHLSGYATAASAALANAGVVNTGQRANADAADTQQWGRAVVLPVGGSAADAVETFRARPVRIELASGAKKLSQAELGALRARAFGLQWEPRNDSEIEYAVHRKEKQACTRSYTQQFFRDGSVGPSRISLKSTDKGRELQVYEMSLDYLGSRDGNDHYLLEASIWEPMSADELTAVATPLLSAEHDGAIVRSVSDSEDFATEVTINYRADGVAQGQRIRRHSYELVNSGEALRLKLAEHVLLIFGLHEPVSSDGSPCTECAQLAHFAVGESLAGSPVR